MNRKAQRGFSIVELMVAMTISLLLLAGVLSVMYTSRITYDENARIARLQEYARSSVELMLRDLRSAGYHGCARPLTAQAFRTLLTAPNALRYNFARAIEGFEGTAGAFAPALNAVVVPAATPGNDVVVVRTVSPSLPPFVTSATFAGGGGSFQIAKPSATTLPAGTPLLISDCQWANVVANSATVGSGATVNVPRGK